MTTSDKPRFQTKDSILLVGHGGAPTDFPKDKLSRLKRLESERMSRGGGPMSEEEAALDDAVRRWPRTPRTDPYKFGLEALGRALSKRLGGARVVCAYNEFCGPSMEEAVGALVEDGCASLRVITTMFTRGGIHSECEIPFSVQELRKKHPALRVDYAWPFDEALAADFMARQLELTAAGSPRVP